MDSTPNDAPSEFSPLTTEELMVGAQSRIDQAEEAEKRLPRPELEAALLAGLEIQGPVFKEGWENPFA